MISSYLLYAKICPDPDSALAWFAQQRTSNSKGVTIPSQMRYVRYFYAFLKEYLWEGGRGIDKFPFEGCPYVLTNVRIITVPRFNGDKGCQPFFIVKNLEGDNIYDSRKLSFAVNYKNEQYINIPCSVPICGDFRIDFRTEEEFSGDKAMFHFWISTAFLQDNFLYLDKRNIDKANKDKSHKVFDEEMGLELFFRFDDLAFFRQGETSGSSTSDIQKLWLLFRERENEFHDLKQKREDLEVEVEQAYEENDQLRATRNRYRKILKHSGKADDFKQLLSLSDEEDDDGRRTLEAD